ncbi:MAG: hypothetical protein ILA07_10585 [Prevotella sp.]|nr:hypothetical protein [Prevotella sp.]MBP3828471.1 hypothetical protein [Prevotella sp.]
MKKEYKAPMLSKIIMEVEYPMMNESQSNEADSKKSGRIFEDDEDIAPAAPKKFWDDEE